MQRYIFPLFLFLTIGWFFSCNEEFSNNPNCKLEFSTDTLHFDTVFTTIGSTTAHIMVYNRNKENIKISNVAIGKGSTSFFHMNIDGMTNSENAVSNIEIRGKDSLYLFVELNIDPTQQNSPVFVEDYIQFCTNGNVQKIQLEAYGQDVEIFRRKYILNDTTLLGEKPYLVYDYLAIDTAKTLTLSPGCQFYFHDKAQMVVYGNLKAKGTLEKPILLRGDRLDDMFANVPYHYTAGQWDGLYLIQVDGLPGFVHELNNVEIWSGTIGLYLLGINNSQLPKLLMTNSMIHNFTTYGLVAQNSDTEIVNTEISNCAATCVYLSGGSHTFIHNTIANYFGNTNTISQTAQRDKQDPYPAVYFYNLSKQTAPMHTTFINCVVAGSIQSELAISTPFLQKYDGIFHNNYLKCDTIALSKSINNTYFQEKDTIFENTYVKYGEYSYYNFELDSVSPARGIADTITAAKYPTDRKGRNRMQDGKPDAGAYEYTEEERQK